MKLDLETFGKITNLLRLPMKTVQYNGSTNNTVCFLVGETDQFKNWVWGIALHVSEDFKIKRVERIRVTETTGQRNRKIETKNIPIFKP